MSNYAIYKELFKINKLALKRDPNYETNKVMKIIGYIFMGFSCLLFAGIGIALFMSKMETLEDVEPVANILNYSIGGVLLYELFLRALMIMNKPTIQPFAFYILPVPKRKIVLFRQLYSAFTRIALMFFIMIAPTLSFIAYTYNGAWGIFASMVLFALLWVLNKQIFDFAQHHFRKHKVLTILVVLGYAACVMMPVILQNFDFSSQIIFYTLIPSPLFFILNLTIFLGLIYILIEINNKAMRTLSMDDVEESASVSEMKLVDKITNKLGELGVVIKHDLKLVFRTKQIKIALLVLPIFIWGIVCFQISKAKDADSILVTNSFTMGYMAIMYIMSISPYQAFHLSFFHTKQVKLKQFFWSAWIINIIYLGIIFTPLMILSYIKLDAVIEVIAAYLNNSILVGLGLLAYIPFNTIAINPHTKSRNTSNFSGAMFGIMFGIPIINMVVLGIFSFISDNGMYYLILFNILLLCLYPWFINKLSLLMAKRKHQSLEKIMNN